MQPYVDNSDPAVQQAENQWRLSGINAALSLQVNDPTSTICGQHDPNTTYGPFCTRRRGHGGIHVAHNCQQTDEIYRAWGPSGDPDLVMDVGL